MKSLALFDFDGTLYLKDSFTGFIFYTFKARYVLKTGLSILPWINHYYLGLYSADKMRKKLFYNMFSGQSLDHVQHDAMSYTDVLQKYLNPQLLAQLKQHQALGHDVVIVSASVDIYLKPLCDRLKVDLISSEVDSKNGQLTGFYKTPDCSGLEKKRRVEQRYDLNTYSQIYAYGNTLEDVAMLSLATQPYMYGQDPLPILGKF
ncbi:HAD-superfamily subfamily IB hydrolase, TIGR01490 [Acinetobacter boissieri]|uniref:HAD-superfamily subfamily IB hydrolase, TIGR01490 n=2 Tax=Acinetobacter boissieri TaxID=1219383 RepID=A0A1G6H0K5_9GAMM|nr:HAD-IB family hydrolase [Acinetobacter boissieri]SDB87678.1 HAD-superfamily subfamily IB hydrolase, TIGR01490 [Acinetobacter boissieri]